ncbi:hypothetical protein BC937DRAFT_91408 [Endogone sp. FLAS-F59071]|nr:hypothetical protein BC937DRAFT_91408 [Endogone sp. FLAS-F59071]|eukprot:RUS16286.1 hypothetical protein BC937DRAFT_91408 [Endogone sp. FLAS-F59071]
MDLVESISPRNESALYLFNRPIHLYVPTELNNDPIILSQLAALYDTLLEQNLVRIIEPFSRVEIARVAEIVKLPTAQVETK